VKWTDREAPTSAMETLNRVSGMTLWEEMVNARREFCLKDCQNNKVVNMLRPKCTDRRYLDVLLLKRDSKKNLPAFCYSQRIKGLMRAFQEGDDLTPDVYVFVDDFWKIVHEKQKSRRSSFFKRSTRLKETLTLGSLDYQIETHYIRGMLFILWPKIELVLVAASETAIHSFAMFESVAECLADTMGLEVSMEVEGNFIELRFENLILQDAVIVEKKLSSYPAFTGFSGTEIWAEISLPSMISEEETEFKVKDLHQIYRTVSELIEPRDEKDTVTQASDDAITETADTKTAKKRGKA